MLIQLLLVHISSEESDSIAMHDFAFGIWTGKKMIKSRILPLAKTWLKFVPSIDIYSDYLDMDDVYEVLNSSNHLNITFHTIPVSYTHLTLPTTERV